MSASSPSSQLDLDAARDLMVRKGPELLAAPQFAPVLGRFYEGLASALGMQCFLHYEPSPAEGSIQLLAHGGLPSKIHEALTPALHADVVCGDVYRSGVPVVFSAADIESDKRMWWARVLGLRSYACHPLIVSGRVAGTLAFAGNIAELTSDAVSLMFSLSAQVSMAMAHRQLDEEAALQARRRQREFFAVLAHELRNPMAPIRSGIDIARSQAASAEDKARAFSMMDRQLTRMTRLVDDLLDAARIDGGMVKMRLEPMQMRDVVDAAVESVEPALRAKNQTIVVNGDGLDAMVMADSVRLSQAVSNVLNNCAKFTPHGGRIDVETAVASGQVALRIRDRGAPIPASDLPGTFKLFAQANRRGAGDGMGVGLALVKTLVELHGGTVTAGNAPGDDGAEFMINLPLLEAVASDDRSGSVSGASSRPAVGQRVLVVDDNEDAAESLCMLLEFEGKTLRIARDGLTAVAEAAEFRPDYIFMDIGLPDISGVEATRRIRALSLQPRPFICALTGLGAVADREATAAAGCDLHLTKPIDIKAALELMGEPR